MTELIVLLSLASVFIIMFIYSCSISDHAFFILIGFVLLCALTYCWITIAYNSFNLIIASLEAMS